MTAVSIVPPTTPNHTRQVTPSIRTSLFKRRTPTGDHWVSAVYENPLGSIVYADPRDAPRYARILPAGQGRRTGKWNGKWDAVIRLQAVEQTETAALAALMAALDDLQVPYERELAQAILLALASATGDTPHAQRPMGARRPKPRAKRHAWTTAEGQRIAIYADTLRRHRDPRCVCQYCTIFVRNNTTTKKTEP